MSEELGVDNVRGDARSCVEGISEVLDCIGNAEVDGAGYLLLGCGGGFPLAGEKGNWTSMRVGERAAKV